MLILLASRFDEHAALWAERWKHRGACLLTCDGLSRRGWRHESAVPERSLAVLDGALVPVTQLRGVLTRLPFVTEDELPHIVASERAYVASEMQAFLVAWLASLPCRVLNRPTPLDLTGPAFRQEQWAQAALSVGLRVRPIKRVAPAFTSAAPEPAALLDAGASPLRLVSVTLIGEQCISDGPETLDATLVEKLKRLAEFARVALMTATFADVDGDAELVGASAAIDLSRPDLAAPLLEALGCPP